MNKLEIAGRQLIKGNIGNAITALVTKSTSSEMIQPSRWRNGNFFFGVNGADKAFIWGNYNSSLVAYQQCPVVSSIINRMAQCAVNGKRFIMDANGKESQSVQAKAIKKLLNRPNRMQTGKQFKAQGNVYKRIYGYCPVLVIKPVGFEADYTRWKLWNIPPWMIQVEDSSDLYYEQTARNFKAIWLTYMGHNVSLNPDSIYFLKENQISTSTYLYNSQAQNVSLFLPDSRLAPLEKPIDNLIASFSSRGSLIRERGPQWLLTNDSNDSGGEGLFPSKPDDIQNLHKDFMQYGIMTGQRKAIITDAKLKLQEVGFDVSQLKLLEGEVQDAKLICDGLNYPPYLMGLIDSKFDNQAIAERTLYTNSIIPDSESEDEQWTELLQCDQYGLTITTDFSHLAPLQENITEQGRGRWYMNQALLIEWMNDGITWNRWRELLGEDTVPGMDLYYSDMVKSGRIIPGGTSGSPTDVSGDTANQNNPSNSNSNSNG
jgi:hypothetical protein